MKTPNNDPDADYRKWLALMADRLVGMDPDHQRKAVAGLLTVGLPENLRFLAKLLVKRLEYKNQKVCDGAANALALLGPGVLPALERAAWKKPSEALLLRLAPLFTLLGWQISEGARTLLQMQLMIAAGRAPSKDSSAAMWAAVECLREPAKEEHSTLPLSRGEGNLTRQRS